MNPNIKHVDIDGSDREFYLIGPSYSYMVEVLGEPNVKDDPDKVDASWAVRHDDGREVAFWNYKNGPAYLGAEASMDDIDRWSAWGDKELAHELFPYAKLDWRS